MRCCRQSLLILPINVWCIALLLLCGSSLARGAVRLPAVISEHMVLQADSTVPIWGWAEPGEGIEVSFSGITLHAKAGADGRWSVSFEKLPASRESQTLTVKGHNTVRVEDVLVGEVWLASGQSNMEMQIKGKQHGAVDRADEEIAAAHYPQIRMFLYDHPFDIYASRGAPDTPQSSGEGRWWVCSPETVAPFSAVGYFFARELHQELKSPVGVLVAAVGGTPIEAWTSMEAQSGRADFKAMLDDWQRQLAKFDASSQYDAFQTAKKAWLKLRGEALKAGQPAPKAPTPFKNLQVLKPAGLFNGVIAPLIPYKVRGVIWYQGERNAAGPFTGLYGKQLAAMISDWRQRWGDGFYFAWVQLPRFKVEQRLPVEPKGWGVAVRDEMRKTLRLPKTAMAITIDMGDVTAGHPTNKADYAHRLALLALHDVYARPIAECSGPLFRSAKMEGGKMILSFDHASGLKASSGDLKGFAIAGDDQKFVWATATVHGDSVAVFSEKVPDPKAVRYAWASNPTCNLVNGAGLPASPFRTDDWAE